MDLGTFADRLDDRLDIDRYAGIDASANGLQVGDRDAAVDHVGLAVDAALETIDQAGDIGADVLVVHHGLFWGDIDDLTGQTYDRIAALCDHDLGLYAAHLPLDGHQESGNAAAIAGGLDLTHRQPFATLDGIPIGVRGLLKSPINIDRLLEEVAETVEGELSSIDHIDAGPAEVRSVAIVTGSGSDFIDQADQVDADVLITGESKHAAYHAAHETDLHVVCAGHYATETFGVRAIGDVVRHWGLDATFIDVPTGL